MARSPAWGLNQEWTMRAWSGDLGDDLPKEYPCAYMEIDARWMILYSPIFSLEALGALYRAAGNHIMAGYTEWVEELPFVRRVRLGPPDGKRARIPTHIRDSVLSPGVCAVCGVSDDLHVDHIHPVVRGGTNDPDNLQCLCQTCNLSKGAKTMEEWGGVDG